MAAATDEELNEMELPWRLAVVDLDDIYFGRYQRPLDERWLKDRPLKPSLLGTVTLSERTKAGKHYAGIDGQHRIELLRRNGQKRVAAVVFHDLTEAQEAGLFSQFQQERRNITPFQRFTADLFSGSERAKQIKKIVEEEGWWLGDVGSNELDKIKAIRLCERVYDEDPALLRMTLRSVHRAWFGLPYANNERMLSGVAQFLREVPDFDEVRFRDRLSNVTPSTIIDRAQSLRDGRGTSGALPRFIAEAIENQYRSRRR